MPFLPYQGDFHAEWWLNTAADLHSINSIVSPQATTTSTLDGTSFDAADATSGDLLGVLQRAITATDDAYTTAEICPILVPDSPHCIWKGDTNSTAATSHVGKYVDLTNSTTINEAGSSKLVLHVAKYFNTSQLGVKFSSMAAHKFVATS